jgi:hypothetical protein
LGFSDVEGNQEGGNIRGSKTREFSKGYPRRKIGDYTPEVRDNIRERSEKRIPRESLKDPSEVLLSAFTEGNFDTAYAAAKALQKAYHEVLLELSETRFKLYFGSSICQNCDGLKAGPNVIATCYQIKRCNFDNIKKGDENPSKLAIIDRLKNKLDFF